MKFSRTNIEALTLPEGEDDRIEWDPDLPGFGVRFRRAADRTVTKNWRVQYRVGSQQRSQSLGDIRKVTLEDARKIARQIFARVELGIDPGAERDAGRRAQPAAALTLGSVAERYLLAKKATLRPNTFAASTRYFGDHWAPLHHQPIGAVTRAQIAARLQELTQERGPVAASRARCDLGTLFSWAMREGLCEANPVAMTNDPAAGRRGRDRVLAYEELRAILRACGDDDFSRIIWLLALTCCRASEIGDLQWGEISFETGAMTIPGARIKNHREHVLSLPEAALAILRPIPRRPNNDFVFGKSGFSAWSYSKMMLDARIARVEGSPLAPWVVHDVRRSAATHMAELGVQPHIVEAVLNHQGGHKRGIAGIYNRAAYTAEKKTALALWADKLRSVVDNQESNVTLLPKRA
jgi:integrase